MRFLDTVLAKGSFVCSCLAILVGPWFFGAWEMWWFWPFVVCIFVSSLFFSVRLLMPAAPQAGQAGGPHEAGGTDTLLGRFSSPRLRIVAISCIPFLLYAFVRSRQADVLMDAERSFLLFFMPFLLGVQIVFGFSRKQLDLLWKLLLLDLCFLGLYGIINHGITGSRLVLWVEGYEQYTAENRASGSYFCPDHFSGIMELALCMTLGLLLAREKVWQWKVFGALLLVIAVWGTVLSKSRGGGLTLVVIGGASLVWGFSQWRAATRWCWRVSLGAVAVAALVVFCNSGASYMGRFANYFDWERARGKPLAEVGVVVGRKLMSSSRGRMISAAVRAWRSNSTTTAFGIGPGMHRNVWPGIAASPDGDRELGVWPTYPNYHFHSYHVHSDWVQLLEEYGVVGLALLVLPASVLFGVLLAGIAGQSGKRRHNGSRATDDGHYAVVLSGVLACVCMAFHSLGDFNLHMPATGWLLAAIVATATAYSAVGVSSDRRTVHARSRTTPR